MQIHIHKNNQQYGPYEQSAILELVRNGQCSLTDLAIREGMNEWQPLWAVVQVPFVASGDLEAEFKLFEVYGETLDSMTSALRDGNPQVAQHGFRQYEQLLSILENLVNVVKKQFPNTEEVRMMESFYYQKCAGLELFRSNMDAALDMFDKSINVLDTPGAHLVKASIYQNLNRRSEAIRELDWVIAKFPDLEQEHLAARQMRNQI